MFWLFLQQPHAQQAQSLPPSHTTSTSLFGGEKPLFVDSAAWQAGREAALAADPTQFDYVTGQVTVDWDTDTLLSFDISYAQFGQTFDFSSSNPVPGLVGEHQAGGGDPTRERVLIQGTREAGDLKTFGSGQGSIVTSEQYQSELLFSLTYFPTLDYAFVNDIIISNREFQEVDVFEPYNPFSFNFNPIGTTGRYQTLGTVYGENRFTPGSSPLDGFTGLTINDGSPNTSPVPLPAAAWMLLAAVGGLFGLRRRSV